LELQPNHSNKKSLSVTKKSQNKMIELEWLHATKKGSKLFKNETKLMIDRFKV